MMERFYRMLVRHPRVVTLAFLLAAGVSLLCWPLVDVNYDMNDYLPPESASTIALDTLGEEYDGGIPNARVLVRNVTLPEALAFKEQLQQIDGVTEVTWLDDSVSVLQPLEVIDKKLLETYYQDDSALYSLVIAEDKRVQAVEDIRTLIGEGNAVTGAAASTADATTSTVTQIMKIAIVAVIFVLCILLLTTTSWLEPFIVLGSLGVAIVINSGSNLIFGEISFVSNAAGPVLQLAVSLDYSVFLLHRFDECRKEFPDKREAMVQALCKSTSSILSSGLTTVIGFLALCLMQFQIGPDLGLVLAKGVAISLLTVFLFSPVLILQCSTLMDRLHHRSFMPSFARFGR
ncbi:MAG: MMPL family transporter, partial [Aristaeellaceae bacterium]